MGARLLEAASGRRVECQRARSLHRRLRRQRDGAGGLLGAEERREETIDGGKLGVAVVGTATRRRGGIGTFLPVAGRSTERVQPPLQLGQVGAGVGRLPFDIDPTDRGDRIMQMLLGELPLPVPGFADLCPGRVRRLCAGWRGHDHQHGRSYRDRPCSGQPVHRSPPPRHIS
jgi:hypothetical protein